MRTRIIAHLLLSLGLAGGGARTGPAPAPAAPAPARAPASPAEAPAPLPSPAVQPLLAQVGQLWQAKKLPEALQAAEQALAAARSLGDAPGEAIAQRARAVVLQALGRSEDAVAGFRAAAAAWERAGDGPGQIEALAQAGLLLAAAHPEGTQAAQAEALIVQAVELGKAEKKRPRAAGAALLTAGGSSFERGQFDAAHALSAAALAIFERLAPGSLEVASSLNELGRAAWQQDDLEGAKQYHLQALAIREKLDPGSLAVAQSFNNLGLVTSSQENLAEAKQYHLQALAIREKLDPGSWFVALSLGNLGSLAYSQGDLEGARQYFQQALTINEKRARGSLEVASSLTGLGLVAWQQGDLARAMQYHQQALAISEKLAPGSLAVAPCLLNLGAVARQRGDLEGARQYFQQALAIYERLAPGSLDVATSLNDLGLIAWQQGDLARAMQYHLQALTIREKRAPGSLVVAQSLNNLGLVARQQGHPVAARQYHLQALAINEKLAAGSLEVAMSLNNLGLVAWQQGDLAGAKQYHLQALAIREKRAPGSLVVAQSLDSLGNVAREQGNLPEAERRARQAWEIVRAQGGQVIGDEARQAFDASTAVFASHLLGAQIALGKAEAAFGTLEAGRAQALRQLLLQRQLSPRQVPPALWAAYQQAVTARDQAEQALSRDGEAEARARLLLLDAQQTHAAPDLLSQRRTAESAAQQQIEAAQAGYLRARDTVAQRWAAVQQSAPQLFAPPLSLAQAAQALPVGTLFVAFAVSEDQTHLFLLQRGPSGRPALRTFSVPLGERRLWEQVQQLAREVSRPDSTPAAASRALFAALFPPEAQRLLEQAQRLLISPDGPLWELPFAALVTNRQGLPRYLGLEKPLTFTPSLALFAQAQRKRPARPAGRLAALIAAPFCTPSPLQLAALSESGTDADGERGLLVRLGGTPQTLPGSGPEALHIARLYDAQPLLGPAATEAAIRRRIRQAAVIHLATHGYVHPLRAMDYGLLLTPPAKAPDIGQHENDGVLQAWEIAELPLSAELVVLSACETGTGQNVRSEGIVGLVRALQVAGARSIVASQWAVADASTAELMLAFHRGLRRGLEKDEALRQAMLKVAREKETASPYFWAPFFLVGDPENGGLGAAPHERSPAPQAPSGR